MISKTVAHPLFTLSYPPNNLKYDYLPPSKWQRYYCSILQTFFNQRQLELSPDFQSLQTQNIYIQKLVARDWKKEEHGESSNYSMISKTVAHPLFTLSYPPNNLKYDYLPPSKWQRYYCSILQTFFNQRQLELSPDFQSLPTQNIYIYRNWLGEMGRKKNLEKAPIIL